MIKSMYNMFVAIAAVVYTTILLYIGVKVLFGVSTPRQGEYKKDLTNWVVGIVLLFAVPQFFRFIPSMVNSVVSYIGGSSRIIMYSYYNMDGVLDAMDSEKVGTSGEDNRSTYIERLKGIRADKQGQLASVRSRRKWLEKNGIFLNSVEYQAALSQVQSTIEALRGKYDTKKVMNLLNQEIGKASGEVDPNKLASRVLNRTKNNSATSFPGKLPSPIGTIPNPIKSFVDPLDIEKLANALSSSGYIEKEKALLERLDTILINYDEEKTLEEEIANLTALIDAPDLMGDMRVLAGQTGRFTYAIVWWICIYEMIVILCMYYRRVIVIGILITIYPLVAMTYPIDKLKDGKAQTLTNWYKEFTVNLVVQIVHAVVYIVLVQSGIKLYQANANNWLFFILAVLFLFPAERLMRGIFGLKGTSIKELKANAVGIAGAAATAVTLGKQTGRAANEKFGITKKGKEAKANKQKAADKAKKNRDNRDKYLQGRADIKENQRKQKAAQRRRRAASMHGARRMAYNAYAKTMNAANRARSAAYKLGNKGRKLKGQYRKLQDSNLAKYAKSTWRVARGATGMAVGAANFVTTSGTSGLGAGFVSGTSVARMVGGFKDRDRLQKAIDNRASSQTANTSQNTNVSGNGSNGGYTPKITPKVNVPPSISGAPSPNNGSTSASSGNVQVNVNTTTAQNVNTKTDN